MDSISYKTKHLSKSTVDKTWVLVDATDQVVGRLASKIANRLRGKHKPSYSPHVDCGDFVVVINAEKVRFTGKKEQQKVYERYSGYPGGKTSTSVPQMREKDPTMILYNAVKGMLPKNKLSDKLMTKLKLFVGEEHTHDAQNPEKIEL